MRQTDGKINTTDIVKKQYENAGNLNTRISIHSKYSANKLGFGNWIVSNKGKYRQKEWHYCMNWLLSRRKSCLC